MLSSITQFFMIAITVWIMIEFIIKIIVHTLNNYLITSIDCDRIRDKIGYLLGTGAVIYVSFMGAAYYFTTILLLLVYSN